MDIYQAIDAHMRCRGRLAAYLASQDLDLDVFDVAQDDACDLGRWLHEEGRVHSGWTGFERLVNDHARLHRAAAELAARANAGERVTQEIARSAKSEFTKASNAVITALELLKRRGRHQSAAGQTGLSGTAGISPLRWQAERSALLATLGEHACAARAGDSSGLRLAMEEQRVGLVD